MKRFRRRSLARFLVVPVMLVWFGVFTLAWTPPAPAQTSYAGTLPAEDFPPGLDWLNTDHPISLEELRGKVVLLDFWTYCCINCIHILPELKRLEKKYENELVVIGVHSAKFTTEKGTENIREAILRYEIEHPVVNDHDFIVWRSHGVNAWPSFIMIDPDGNVVGQHSGEGIYDLFDEVIASLVEEFDAAGKLDRGPTIFALERDRVPASLLSFPAKLAVDESGDRLFVSDSNHDRIVVLKLPDGEALDLIGGNGTGLKNGGYEEVQFNKPQGLAVDGEILYVADTENHVIRKVDLAQHTVSTLAGTGRQAHFFEMGGTGTEAGLNSPWDLLVHKGKLFIAMAGSHQLWSLDLKTLEVEPHAGSGRENIIDGPLLEAQLAQPSGITTDGKKLYFADSEVSAIRTADLNPKGKVETLVGQGLFDYGDVDGRRPAVRLQHPLGVLYHDGLLYVADTYNNKIKTVDPKTGETTSLIGTGEAGMKDGEANMAELNEPNDVAYAGGNLYIIDTNNHAVRVFHLDTGRLSTLSLRRAEKLVGAGGTLACPYQSPPVEYAAQAVGSGEGRIRVKVELPDGYKINTIAPLYVGYSSEDPGVVRTDPAFGERSLENPSFPIELPALFAPGTTTLYVDLVVYYCETGKEGLCLIEPVRVAVPVEVGNEGKRTIEITVDVGNHA